MWAIIVGFWQVFSSFANHHGENVRGVMPIHACCIITYKLALFIIIIIIFLFDRSVV